MNDGCLRPITLNVPDGSMLRPHHPAAVVAGNVETSQVVTDALFAATGRLAPSQGTMNNFTFGNDRYQYYETVCGGAGAHKGGDGVVRRVTFLEPMRANILADRRRVPPSGLNGGEDAEPGRNWVERTDGSRQVLTATESAEVGAGDCFVIETPGGGGFGRPGG
jgi:5-oxoprolinase (ATP-hydrolysing)